MFHAVGYRNIAIEQVHKHETLSLKGDPIPVPVNLKELQELTKGKLNLYNRLTISYTDPSISHALGKSQNIKKYHIVAALPLSEAALLHACQTFQGDIISYSQETIRIRLSRKFYYLAIRRNMFFELKYSPAIVDSNERKATITRAQQYHMVGKSKGIVISSGATDRFHIRSPNDISSLALIFGLSEEQANCAISTTSHRVLIAAESRRLGRTPALMRFEDVNSSTSEESSEDEMEINSSTNKRRADDLKPVRKSKKLKSWRKF